MINKLLSSFCHCPRYLTSDSGCFWYAGECPCDNLKFIIIIITVIHFFSFPISLSLSHTHLFVFITVQPFKIANPAAFVRLYLINLFTRIISHKWSCPAFGDSSLQRQRVCGCQSPSIRIQNKSLPEVYSFNNLHFKMIPVTFDKTAQTVNLNCRQER